MEIVYKKVNDLIPYINNSRTHSEEQVNQIVASINEFGFTNPLLIDEKDNIIAGHGRLLASKKLKMEKVPCIVLSGLTEAQKKAYIIADNKMALNAGWDEELLKIELENLEIVISKIARDIYNKFPTDGKYILTDNEFIICQSNATTEELKQFALTNREYIINPLGEWTGGTDVDSGATNRKLGSDMAQSVTGGGLHGKDLSKADVSVNIYAFLKAQETGEVVELCCAIGDDTIDGKPYSEIVEIARDYINKIGGFEKFAEWGLY